MKEIRAAARERMKGHCRVCPVCDGKACSGEVPGMGGLGTGASFRNNREALNACKLNMTALHDAREPRTNCTILGIDLSFPVMAAPIGGVSFNMSDAMSEDDYIFAILEGSRAAGVIGCTGDGVPPFIIDAAVKALKACNGHGIPFIKPWEGKELFEKIDRVLADGSPILGVDVDAAGLITLRKMGRPVMPMSVTELETVVRYVHDMGRKFIVKGIMTPDDAHRAIDAGCDAIVVSNHGGRVLDHCPGTATVLPAIADAVRGKITILADGAVRDGVDVLKMLALGADAVLVGRPLCIAAIGGGVEGVTKYWQQMQGQLVQAMLLTGCASLAGEELRLTTMEYKLLCLLARNTGKVLTHKYIIQKVWGSSWGNDVGTLRVLMATLRKKLEAAPDSPQYIQTHIGIGYRMLKIEETL